MDQESGFHPGRRALEPLIRPLDNVGLRGLEGAGEEAAPGEQACKVGDRHVEEVEGGEVRTLGEEGYRHCRWDSASWGR